MENSSKALIIAGAILVGIILISVGILVINSINTPLDQGTKEGETQAAQIFNAKFKPYLGIRNSDEIRELIYLVDMADGVTMYNKSGYISKTEQLVDGKHYIVDYCYGSTGKIYRVDVREKH